MVDLFPTHCSAQSIPTSTKINLHSPTRANLEIKTWNKKPTHTHTSMNLHLSTTLRLTHLINTQLRIDTTSCRFSHILLFFFWSKMHWVMGSHHVDPLNSTVELPICVGSDVVCWGREMWYTSIIDAKGTTQKPTLLHEKRELEEEGITYQNRSSSQKTVVWGSSIWNALQYISDAFSRLLGWLWAFLLWDQYHWIVIWRCQHWPKGPVFLPHHCIT